MALVIGNKTVSWSLGFLRCNTIAIHSSCLKAPAPGSGDVLVRLSAFTIN